MKQFAVFLSILMTSLASVAAPAAKPDNAADEIALLKRTSRAFTSVAEKAMPAVVFITVERTVSQGGGAHFNDPFGFFGDEFFDRFFRGRGYRAEPRRFVQRGQGSGFIISKDGYILTNNHVVGDADKITVRTHDGKEHAAKRIGSDPKSEVAVIKIEGKDFPFVELGDSTALDIGEWVIAVGNPFGLTETLTVGVVSAKGRSNLRIAEYEDFIQTDAAINPGNSGGPLLNIEGKVVGINTAIFSQTGGYIGIGFAIPINMAKMIKDQLVKSGKVIRGYLGVVLNPRDIDEDLAKSFGLKKAAGVLVTRVIKGSPAEKAGLKDEDVITRINGTDVENNGSFRNTVSLFEPGSQAKVTVMRDGKEHEFKVTIGTMPDSVTSEEDPGAKEADLADRIGLQVGELDADTARRLGYDIAQGVLVAQVKEGSPADRAEIQPGYVILSVNRKPVTTVAAYQKALEESIQSKRVLLRVRNPQYSWFVLLKLD